MDIEQKQQILSYLAHTAMQYRFRVAPNPCVGAGIIYKNTLVAEGYHTAFGKEHAEIACIMQAKKKGIPLKECTLIVTLEPCAHTGKTPPCVERIVAESIPNVIIGASEPTEHASGGAKILHDHNIIVEILENKACSYCIQDFTTWNAHHIPHIILKLASTIDGYIATRSHESKWITNEKSRHFVHTLRKDIAENNGAILVGANTVRYDNPQLRVRNIQSTKHPRPVIVSSTLEGLSSSFLLQERAQECIIITSHTAMETAEAKLLLQCGATCIPINWSKKTSSMEDQPPSLALLEALQLLYTKYNILYILCEGGAQLAHSIIMEHIPMELYHFTAPMLFADTHAIPLIHGSCTLSLRDAFTFSLQSTQTFESDILSIYTIS